MGVDIKRFKFKIFLIFLIPAVSMVYFTYFYVKLSDANIEALEYQKQNIIVVNKLVDVVHHLQIERGLSVGFINAPNPQNFKTKLLNSYKNSDHSINSLKKLHYTSQVDIKQIQRIRQKVLDRDISFNEVLQRYTQLNNTAINTIKYLLPRLDKNRYDALFLINLELLKENLGLERAYIYYNLLSEQTDPKVREEVLYLQQNYADKKKDLLLYVNKESLKSYEKYIDPNNLYKLENFQLLYKQNQLNKKDAESWFEVATTTINAYNQISKELLTRFVADLDHNYDDTLHNLNIAMVFWLISVITAIYFIYLIHKLFEEHELYTADLELSSHTLDSYEGVVITDKDTRILKVNKGFERITGYSFEDVVGKKASMLKAENNPNSLYKGMWGSLNETGSWSGEVLNKRKDGQIYTQRLSISAIPGSNGKVKHYIGHLFDITELRKAQQEALYQARHDSLTELMNRKYLLKRMSEELSRSKRHNFLNAFLFIDLDDFKNINDTYGHHIGDQLLQHVAYSLRDSIRECDMVARISGDEFAVVLLDIDSGHRELIEVVTRVAKKILTQLNREIEIESNKIFVSSSIGVRIFPQTPDDNAEQIIQDADSAMYLAKNSGKNRFIIFDQT
ncbi:MAG: diguanylate cyclase [Sulfurimonas sp.]